MSASIAIRNLRNLLCDHARLAAAGYVAELDGQDVLVISRRGGHVRGLWREAGGALDWTPAGYGEPTHRVLTADAALLHTLSILRS